MSAVHLILHIPHSSTHIPFYDGFVADIKIINNEIFKLTDWYTNELFHCEKDIMVQANFSRIFCDVERFPDDSQEIMAQYGMGVMYEKTDSGEIMRMVTSELKNRILKEYYWPHHKRLNQAVIQHLDHFNKATIIDCHSFSNTPFIRDLNQDPNRPDFNIGTDPYHTPQKLIDIATAYFKNNGYSFGIDWPYNGTIVPLDYYQKDSRVCSIMLEVNRKLYMNEQTGERIEKYDEIRNMITGFIELIRGCVG